MRAPALFILLLLSPAAWGTPADPGAAADTVRPRPRAPADSGVTGEGSPLSEQLDGADEAGEIELLPGEDVPEEGTGGWRLRWRSRAAGRIQAGRGYTDGRYAGNRVKLYNRLTIDRGSLISAGILTEKDPGERSLTDHITGSISVRGRGWLPGIVAGDFRVRAGQRLVFSGGRTFGKGSDVVTPARRTGWGISSAPTSDEFNFFRGIAMDASSGPFEAAAFISRRKHSAVPAGDGPTISLDETGYHRTATEIGRRDGVAQKSLGLLLRFGSGERLHLGLNLFRSTLQGAGWPVAERKESMDFLIRTPVVLFGEFASLSGSLAAVGGMLFDDDPRVRVILCARAYPPGELLTPAGGFSDRSGARDEKGVYLGVEITPGALVTCRGYLDLFSSDLPSRDAVFPRRGVDRLISITLGGGRGFRVGARLRSREIEKKGAPARTGDLQTPADGTVTESRWRVDARWITAPRTTAGVRFDYAQIPRASAPVVDRGVMLLADLRAEPVRGLGITFRSIFFRTDSYDARLYETESDLPGSLTSGVVYGRGTRWYVIVVWTPSDLFRVSAKFARLTVADRARLGSGAEEIRGNIEERVGLQLDVEL